MYGQATQSGFADSAPKWAQGYNKNYSQQQSSFQLDRSRAKNTGAQTPRKISSAKSSSFKIGDRVFHDKFGYGMVVLLDGNKLEVDFEKRTLRKVMDSFVTPASGKPPIRLM